MRAVSIVLFLFLVGCATAANKMAGIGVHDPRQWVFTMGANTQPDEMWSIWRDNQRPWTGFRPEQFWSFF